MNGYNESYDRGFEAGKETGYRQCQKDILELLQRHKEMFSDE